MSSVEFVWSPLLEERVAWCFGALIRKQDEVLHQGM